MAGDIATTTSHPGQDGNSGLNLEKHWSGEVEVCALAILGIILSLRQFLRIKKGCEGRWRVYNFEEKKFRRAQVSQLISSSKCFEGVCSNLGFDVDDEKDMENMEETNDETDDEEDMEPPVRFVSTGCSPTGCSPLHVDPERPRFEKYARESREAVALDLILALTSPMASISFFTLLPSHLYNDAPDDSSSYFLFVTISFAGICMHILFESGALVELLGRLLANLSLTDRLLDLHRVVGGHRQAHWCEKLFIIFIDASWIFMIQYVGRPLWCTYRGQAPVMAADHDVKCWASREHWAYVAMSVWALGGILSWQSTVVLRKMNLPKDSVWHRVEGTFAAHSANETEKDRLRINVAIGCSGPVIEIRKWRTSSRSILMKLLRMLNCTGPDIVMTNFTTSSDEYLQGKSEDMRQYVTDDAAGVRKVQQPIPDSVRRCRKCMQWWWKLRGLRRECRKCAQWCMRCTRYGPMSSRRDLMEPFQDEAGRLDNDEMEELTDAEEDEGPLMRIETPITASMHVVISNPQHVASIRDADGAAVQEGAVYAGAAYGRAAHAAEWHRVSFPDVPFLQDPEPAFWTAILQGGGTLTWSCYVLPHINPYWRSVVVIVFCCLSFAIAMIAKWHKASAFAAVNKLQFWGHCAAAVVSLFSWAIVFTPAGQTLAAWSRAQWFLRVMWVMRYAFPPALVLMALHLKWLEWLWDIHTPDADTTPVKLSDWRKGYQTAKNLYRDETMGINHFWLEGKGLVRVVGVQWKKRKEHDQDQEEKERFWPFHEWTKEHDIKRIVLPVLYSATKLVVEGEQVPDEYESRMHESDYYQLWIIRETRAPPVVTDLSAHQCTFGVDRTTGQEESATMVKLPLTEDIKRRVLVIGSPGSGKSTLLSALCGLTEDNKAFNVTGLSGDHGSVKLTAVHYQKILFIDIPGLGAGHEHLKETRQSLAGVSNSSFITSILFVVRSTEARLMMARDALKRMKENFGPDVCNFAEFVFTDAGGVSENKRILIKRKFEKVIQDVFPNKSIDDAFFLDSHGAVPDLQRHVSMEERLRCNWAIEAVKAKVLRANRKLMLSALPPVVRPEDISVTRFVYSQRNYQDYNDKKHLFAEFSFQGEPRNIPWQYSVVGQDGNVVSWLTPSLTTPQGPTQTPMWSPRSPRCLWTPLARVNMEFGQLPTVGDHKLRLVIKRHGGEQQELPDRAVLPTTETDFIVRVCRDHNELKYYFRLENYERISVVTSFIEESKKEHGNDWDHEHLLRVLQEQGRAWSGDGGVIRDVEHILKEMDGRLDKYNDAALDPVLLEERRKIEEERLQFAEEQRKVDEERRQIDEERQNIEEEQRQFAEEQRKFDRSMAKQQKQMKHRQKQKPRFDPDEEAPSAGGRRGSRSHRSGG